MAVAIAAIAAVTYYVLADRRRKEWIQSLTTCADQTEAFAGGIPDALPPSAPPTSAVFDEQTALNTLDEITKTIETLEGNPPSPNLAEAAAALRTDLVGASAALAATPTAAQLTDIKAMLLARVATVRTSLATATGKHKHAA